MIRKDTKTIYVVSCDVCGKDIEESDEENSFRQGIIEHDTHLCAKHDGLQDIFDYLDVHELTAIKKQVIEIERKQNAKSKP